VNTIPDDASACPKYVLLAEDAKRIIDRLCEIGNFYPGAFADMLEWQRQYFRLITAPKITIEEGT